MTEEHVDRRRAWLLDTLVHAPRPMRTAELWEICPLETPRWTTTPEKPSPANLNANLVQLERRGLVTRLRFNTLAGAYWQAPHPLQAGE